MEGDLARLARSGDNVPSSMRLLQACTECGILLTQSQWNKSKNRCPNGCSSGETTTDFSGMISLLQPGGSWVARWNNK
jgi:RNA polymerase subunit RPABC4/transcription elongation factor Spt4